MADLIDARGQLGDGALFHGDQIHCPGGHVPQQDPYDALHEPSHADFSFVPMVRTGSVVGYEGTLLTLHGQGTAHVHTVNSPRMRPLPTACHQLAEYLKDGGGSPATAFVPRRPHFVPPVRLTLVTWVTAFRSIFFPSKTGPPPERSHVRMLIPLRH